MPEKPFTEKVSCPKECGAAGEDCEFEVKVTWNEVADPDGFIYASDLVFDMQPEKGTKHCKADFGAGTGRFEFTPKGGALVTVDGNNVWDQQRWAVDNPPGYPNPKAPAGPGGCDVEYRDPNNVPIPSKNGGEPYKISYTKGLLDSFLIDTTHPCYCFCSGDDGTYRQGKPLSVQASFTKHAAPKKDNCFIATAALGTTDASSVVALRRFRDDYLLRHPFGRAIIAAYARVSPPIAGWLRPRPLARSIVRRFLIVPVSFIARMFVDR